MLSNSTDAPISTEVLFREHAPFVARFLSRVGVPRDHVEDAVQEVFLAVHRNGGYRPGLAKPTSYLARLCIYAAANRRRRGQAEASRASARDVDELVVEGQDPAQRLQARQDAARLQRALERLPEELATTVLLVDLEGESCVSLAAAFGLPVGTVYWRLHEARKRLKAALAAVDASQKRARRAATQVPTPATGQRSSALGAFMLFGTSSSFERSEAGRLLSRVRAQQGGQPPVDAWLTAHRELVRKGAELPSWAAQSAPLSTSLATLIGPVVGGLTAGGAVLAVVVAVAVSSAQEDPPKPVAATISAQLSAQQESSESSDSSSAVGSTPVVAASPSPDPQEPSPAVLSVVLAGKGAGEKSAPSEGPASSEDGSAPDSKPRGVRAHARARQAAKPATGLHRALPTKEPESELAVQPLEERQAQRAAPDRIDAEPARPVAADRALLELREVARAEQLLESDPARALAVAQRTEKRFPAGYFAEERDYVQAMALLKLGRVSDGTPRARAFLSTYPRSPYRGPLEPALGALH